MQRNTTTTTTTPSSSRHHRRTTTPAVVVSSSSSLLRMRLNTKRVLRITISLFMAMMAPTPPLPFLLPQSCFCQAAFLSSTSISGRNRSTPNIAAMLKTKSKLQHQYPAAPASWVTSSSSTTTTTTTVQMTVSDTPEQSNNLTELEGESFVTFSSLSMSNAEFGQAVPMPKRRQQQDDAEATTSSSTSISTSTATATIFEQSDDAIRSSNTFSKNIIVAVASVALALTNFIWQWTHPVTAIQLLAGMQASSASVTVIGRNDKPTVVDFWAPWCSNCKTAAPTLQLVHDAYKDRINFVMVNGDDAKAWPLLETFGVDAIPHLALVDATGVVETALIGPVPRHVLEADLDALLLQQQQAVGQPQACQTTQASSEEQEHQLLDDMSTLKLPYTMLDAFATRPEQRCVHFEKDIDVVKIAY